jgi:hypothetical protein
MIRSNFSHINIKNNAMLKLFLFSVMIVSLSCSNGQNISTEEETQVSIIENTNAPYSIELKVEKVSITEFKLVTIIKIDSLSYMAPISNSTMSGIFKISIKDSVLLNSNYKLIEHACPVVTNFVWSNAPHKLILGYVEYDQKINVISNSDFTTTGVLQFVIEPRCTLEKITFTLSYKAGEMKVNLD